MSAMLVRLVPETAPSKKRHLANILHEEAPLSVGTPFTAQHSDGIMIL